MPVEPGQDLLHYRLIEKIGEGGMGVVWKARDISLDREVAIKILPPEFSRDAQRLARFEREAKLLASLNHPNVATVYGVHEADGLRFLAMELVPGEDLAERLARGPMNVEQVTCITRRILEALEAAHAQGVVHRDLKPANVRVTPDGNVKILDFGLAKAGGCVNSGQDPSLSPTVTSAGSMPGTILGTAAYMSPEQARGHEADARSDIWAFGCVLWECLTGEKIFAGDTVSDTLAAVLAREPYFDRLPADTPTNVVRLLRRCLVKDANGRLHHAADARIELDSVDADARPPGTTPSAYRIASAVLAVALLVVVGLWQPWAREPAEKESSNPLAEARFTRVTDFEGAEFDAAISRDGRFVAFQQDGEDQYGVFVHQLGTHEFRELAAREGRSMRPVRGVRRVGFNAEGTEIWLHGGTGGRMRAVSLLGGAPRNLLDEDTTNIDWSPDGRRMVFYNRTAGDPMFVADADGANSHRILEPPSGVHQHYPVWSVDGRWIYFSRGEEWGAELDLWRVRPDGSEPERLTHNVIDVAYPTPLDERTLLVIGQDPNGAGPWLWSVDVESGDVRRAGIGLESYSSISASADRRRLVATVEDSTSELWSVPLDDRVVTEHDVVRLAPTAGLRALAPRFSKTSLFFLSQTGRGQGLYRLTDGEIAEVWRGSALLEPPAVSPDGDRVVVLARSAGRRSLRIVSADGAQTSVLAEGWFVRGSATWSPDGRWVATGGTLDGVSGLFKIPVDGGDPVRLVEDKAMNPVWSPDGKMIVYSGEQVGAFSPLKAIDPEGNAIELPRIDILVGGERCRFTPDGSALIFMQGGEGAQDFERLDLKTMERNVLTRFEASATMRTFDVSPEGDRIVFDRQRFSSDVVLIELD